MQHRAIRLILVRQRDAACYGQFDLKARLGQERGERVFDHIAQKWLADVAISSEDRVRPVGNLAI